MKVPMDNPKAGARVLSVFVVFVMVASAVIVIPDANKGAAPVHDEPDNWATYVVISEFYYDQAAPTSTDEDEFVELYNPTASPISLDGWSIEHYNQDGALQFTHTFLASAVIPAYGYYLMGERSPLNPGANGDWTYSIVPDEVRDVTTDFQNGAGDGIKLKNGANVVDQLQWGGGSSTCVEGTQASDPAAGNSLERKSGNTHDEAGGNGWDTDDNSVDFYTRSEPQPQNSASPPEIPSGPVVEYADHVAINEILYDCIAPEGTGEWIELINPTASPVSLNGWTITDGEGTWTFPNRAIGAGKNITIAGDGGRFYQDHGYYADFEANGNTPSENMIVTGDITLANTGETVELRNSGSTLIDVVIYETDDPAYPSITAINFPIGDNDSIKRSPPGAEDETAPTNEVLATYWVEDESPTPDVSDSLPPTVTGVTMTTTPVSCLVEWTTTDATWPEINPMAMGQISYKAGSNPDTGGNTTIVNNQKKTDHAVYLSDLTPSTTYYFLIRTEDGLGHVGYSKNGGSYYSFTTLAAESVAPTKQSGPSVDSITDTVARVYWTTNEASTSTVYYGTASGDYYMIEYNPTLSTSNQVYLTGLNPSTTYYYAIRSADASGNSFYDDNGLAPPYSFTTSAAIASAFYLGDMHAHTGYSDGAGGTDPQDAYVYARDDAQVDIQAVTDHTHYLDATEYSNTISMADAETTEGPGGFIAIAGQEFGLQTWHNHFNIYDANVMCPLPYNTFAVADLYTWMTTARDGGIAPGQFNHPGQGDDYDSLTWTQNGEDVMGTFEIFNAGYGTFEGYYTTFMGAGWHVGVGGNSDNHNADGWADSDIGDGFSVPLTVFQLPYLSRDNVLDRMREGKTYAVIVNRSGVASDDFIHMEFEIAGQPMGSEVTVSGTMTPEITLSTPSTTLNDVFLFEDGVQIASYYNVYDNSLLWTPEITLSPGEHWYYVKATQTDGYGEAISAPIWVTVPAMSQPYPTAPNVHTISHTPNSPTNTDNVVVTAHVEEGSNPIYSALLMYSINGGAYQHASMVDTGIYPDTVAGDGIYAGLITPRADGTNVHYYVTVSDEVGVSDMNPSDAPLHYYSYLVGPNIIINEIYPNGYDAFADDRATADHTEFIELYNPTASAVNLEGYWFDSQYSGGTWAFPAGASIPAGGYRVIVQDSYYNYSGSAYGGFRADPQLNTITPHFEMLDGADLYDDPAVPNMVLTSGSAEIKMSDIYDNLRLYNAQGTIIDEIEYGSDYSYIPGRTIPVSPENCSLTRDRLWTDTDDAMYDFTSTRTPTPGANVGNRPVIHYVQRSPSAPSDMEAVAVSARITTAASITSAIVYYRINGGAFNPATMTNMGSNVWQGTIPGVAAPNSVEYYVYAAFGGVYETNPCDDPSDGEQIGAPETFYIYTVQPHLLITEVYYESNVHVNDAQDSRFIEIYNPDTDPVDITGWVLWGEPSNYQRSWEFPSGSIPGGGVIVIAKTAGDASNTGFFTEFGFLPDYEMYDPVMTSESYTDYDNPSVTNMIQHESGNYDDQIWLGVNEGASYYYDAVYLETPGGLLVDAMEYGTEGEAVPGYPAELTAVGYSLQRDEFATDTDNSLVDFTSALPTPGTAVSNLPTYDIPIAGTGWRFVSFPLDATGSALTVLDDMGGDTTWDIVMWYDPQDSTDPWKTYRVGGTSNDLPTLDNKKGLWVHITSVGSDNLLTVEGAEPVSTSIMLYEGWNLVSYPSMTPRLASDTLPAQTDMVAVFQAAAPYVSDTTNLGTVTMTDGNAYWVHVTSDVTWVVTY